MRTIKREISVFALVLFISVMASPMVSADTDVHVDAVTTENMEVWVSATAGGSIDFWIQGINVEDRFDTLEDCCDWLKERTDLHEDEIDAIKQELLGRTELLLNRTDYLKGLVDSHGHEISSLQSDVSSLYGRTSYLKNRQDYVIHIQDTIREKQNEIEEDQDQLTNHFVSFVAYTHDQIYKVKQMVWDLENDFAILLIGIMIAIISGMSVMIYRQETGKTPTMTRVEVEEMVKENNDRTDKIADRLDNIEEKMGVGEEEEE